ncbi:hypothetical protein [Pelomicrobium sp.]|uniref:hypothetical protein n=1 Tax=Pelomicrobium sp. TaxID=2815319 RepID=UPI002FDD8C52
MTNISIDEVEEGLRQAADALLAVVKVMCFLAESKLPVGKDVEASLDRLSEYIQHNADALKVEYGKLMAVSGMPCGSIH